MECRHRGTELVIRWDGDCRARSLLEVDAATLAALRARADEAVAGSREAMSETIRVTQYVGVAGFGVRYLSKTEHINMLVKGV